MHLQLDTVYQLKKMCIVIELQTPKIKIESVASIKILLQVSLITIILLLGTFIFVILFIARKYVSIENSRIIVHVFHSRLNVKKYLEA